MFVWFFNLTEIGDVMASRMTAAEIRKWVTPFVMRFLIHCVDHEQRVITKEELLQAGIDVHSVEALVQTRRLSPLTEHEDSYQITIET